MLYYDEISTILDHFPEVEFAFAYGSGVIEQSGYNYQAPSKQATTDYPMVDFIFVVKDSELWHKENLEKNPDHYSSLIPMKERSIAWFQDNIPAHFWFNAYAPFPLKEDHPHKGKLLMKYGVINQQNAVKDLSEWTNLYLAGRLHKPVRILRSNPQYDQLMSFNRDSAIKTSLLLLPERFSEMDLYLSIAGLSYLGDIRMRVGAENPKKVSNLVTPIVNHYQKLYHGNVITSNQFFTKTTNDTHFLQNTSKQSRLELVSSLPLSLRTILQRKTSNNRSPSSNDVKNAISSIVSRSASLQTMKGLFTAGIIKSSSYVLAKLSKRFLAKR